MPAPAVLLWGIPLYLWRVIGAMGLAASALSGGLMVARAKSNPNDPPQNLPMPLEDNSILYFDQKPGA